MRTCWKLLCLFLLAVLPLVATSCSGINAGGSVSPASFLLPGLLKNETPPNAPALTPPVSAELAIAR